MSKNIEKYTYECVAALKAGATAFGCLDGTDPGYQICTGDTSGTTTVDTSMLDVTDADLSAGVTTGLTPASETQIIPATAGSLETWNIPNGWTYPGGVTGDMQVEILAEDRGNGGPVNSSRPFVIVNGAGVVSFAASQNGDTTGYHSVTYQICPEENAPAGCGPLITAFRVQDIDQVEKLRVTVPSTGYFGYEAESNLVVTNNGTDILFDGSSTGSPAANAAVILVFIGVECIVMESVDESSSTGGFIGHGLGAPLPLGSGFTWVTAPPAMIDIGCSEGSCVTYNMDGTENTTATFAEGDCP